LLIILSILPNETFFVLYIYVYGMSEAKVTACAKIPQELYELSIQRYTKISIAIIVGLELLKDKESIHNEGKSIPNEDSSIRYAELQNTIKELKGKIIENERLQEINEILKKELEGSRQDKEDLTKIHNNYMAQMQTLIKQKAIETPGVKRAWWQRFW
jgi:hypothetical protein